MLAQHEPDEETEAYGRCYSDDAPEAHGTMRQGKHSELATIAVESGDEGDGVSSKCLANEWHRVKRLHTGTRLIDRGMWKMLEVCDFHTFPRCIAFYGCT